MRIDWDVPIEMDDGVILRADVFRPDDDGRHPVLLYYGRQNWEVVGPEKWVPDG